MRPQGHARLNSRRVWVCPRDLGLLHSREPSCAGAGYSSSTSRYSAPAGSCAGGARAPAGRTRMRCCGKSTQVVAAHRVRPPTSRCSGCSQREEPVQAMQQASKVPWQLLPPLRAPAALPVGCQARRLALPRPCPPVGSAARAARAERRMNEAGGPPPVKACTLAEAPPGEAPCHARRRQLCLPSPSSKNLTGPGEIRRTIAPPCTTGAGVLFQPRARALCLLSCSQLFPTNSSSEH